jgi:hypothetical protein
MLNECDNDLLRNIPGGSGERGSTGSKSQLLIESIAKEQ